MAEFFLTPEQQAEFAARMTGAPSMAGAAVRATPLGRGAQGLADTGLLQHPVDNPISQEAGKRLETTTRELGDWTENHVPTVGAGAYVGRKTADALGLPDAHELRPDLGPGGLSDLSRKTQSQMRQEEAGGATPMFTPGVDVQAAPTLDPNYAKTPAKPGGGAGGSGGFGLKGAYDAARKGGLLTLEQERDLMAGRGNAEAGRAATMSTIHEAEAMRQQREAEDQRTIEQTTAAKHEAFLTRSTELSDELGKMKVDPGRMMRSSSAGTQIAMGIGAALGGALSGLNGGPNETLARIDHMIDRDINAQIQDIDNKKSQISSRNSIFGQMLQETGDRRLAAQQTRIMMLESVKMKMQSDSERLGIPEVQANAQLATNAVQQKIDAAKTSMAKEAYETFQRQAAASAAAARANEERLWQRQKDVFEMGSKTDELAIKRVAAGGDAAKETNAAIAETTKRLGDDKVVANRALIQNMARNVRDDGSIVGFDGNANFKSGVGRALGLGGIIPERITNRATLSNEELKARQDWQQLGLLFQNKVTGTGGSDAQMDKIEAAFNGASTPAERKNVIDKLSLELQRREGLAQGNLTDAQKAEFQRRMGREGLVDLPSSAKVK